MGMGGTNVSIKRHGDARRIGVVGLDVVRQITWEDDEGSWSWLDAEGFPIAHFPGIEENYLSAATPGIYVYCVFSGQGDY